MGIRHSGFQESLFLVLPVLRGEGIGRPLRAGSYIPLTCIDDAGAFEKHPAARYAFGPDAWASKQASVPDNNQERSSSFNTTAVNDGGSASGTPAPSSAPEAHVYYFHVQPNGLPEEIRDSWGNLVWQARYLTWGATVQEHW